MGSSPGPEVGKGMVAFVVSLVPWNGKLQDLLGHVTLAHEPYGLEWFNCLINRIGVQDRGEIVSLRLARRRYPIERGLASSTLESWARRRLGGRSRAAGGGLRG